MRHMFERPTIHMNINFKHRSDYMDFVIMHDLTPNSTNTATIQIGGSQNKYSVENDIKDTFGANNVHIIYE